MRTRAAMLALLSSIACGSPKPLAFTVVTFNTGTSNGQAWTPDGGYGPTQAAQSDLAYGNGLGWTRLVDDTRRFIADVKPDLAGFEEIFYSPDCVNVPGDARAGWVCETWKPGDPSVVQVVAGDGYQIGCNLGKTDKCIAVKRTFGKLRGCDQDLCLDALRGSAIADCGRGARVGRGVIDLVAGGALTVVLVHGTAGFTPSDETCRTKQVEQVFVDLGLSDGAAADGARNLVFGDFNTDPGRLIPSDPSAVRWRDFAGPRKPFHFVTPMGADVTPSYGGLFNIDHIVSDTLDGPCWVAGISEGHPPVTPITYFDHKPHVCSVSEQ